MNWKRVIVFCLFSFLGNTNNMYSQSYDDDLFEKNETDVNIDVAPLDLCLSFCFKINKKIGIGVSGEFGVNFSNLVLMAGKRLGTEKTLHVYEPLDEYDNDRFRGIFGGSIFTRIFYDKKVPVELGIKSEYFFHSVITPNEEDINTGFYHSPYIKAFIPSRFKIRENEKKRNPAFGMEASWGRLVFQRYNAEPEWAIMAAFWVRFDLDYNS